MIETLTNLPPGESVVYHRGYLCHDRSYHTDHDTRMAIDGIGNYAAILSDQGVLFLTQRRIGNFAYEYVATKRKIP